MQKFNDYFAESLEDPLELVIPDPVDSCNQYCDGWRVYLGDNTLTEMLYDEIEEFLMDELDGDELKVERRMETMTDKKVVRLLGTDELDYQYPECPHKKYCNNYN